MLAGLPVLFASRVDHIICNLENAKEHLWIVIFEEVAGDDKLDQSVHEGFELCSILDRGVYDDGGKCL